MHLNKRSLIIACCFVVPFLTKAQNNWNKDGNSYTTAENGAIVQVTLPSFAKTTLIAAELLAIPGEESPEPVAAAGGRGGRSGGGGLRYSFSDDQQKVLLFTKPRREYHNTFYSCWIFDRKSGKLTKVGAKFNELLNPKLSPDGSKIAYVYKSNIYLEDANTHAITQLTNDGGDKKYNGWFDYAYSEELYLTDGLRWSPDSKKLAYFQLDVSKVGTFYMINNTDSIYPKIVPIVFSKVGEPMAAARIGVITVADKKTKMMNIPGDPATHYITRLEWTLDGNSLIAQQLNRAQNNSKLILANPVTGAAKEIYNETDEAWIDIKPFWNRGGGAGWDWIENGKAFIWASEKDGWRHLYRITLDGQETLLTPGNYDVTSTCATDEKNGYTYFIASPDNATQRYLYRTKLNNPSAPAERLNPASQPGTHSYAMSPNGLWANHSFSSYKFQPASEWVSLPANTPLNESESIARKLVENPNAKNISFFTVTTAEGISMDGWMVKPKNFDPTKKYPLVFTTYSEPAGATVSDNSGIGSRSSFFNVDSGYIFIGVEGRGTPVPKGRAWRKAIYKSVGWINVNDQAGAAREILKWPFIDPTRVAVYGSSGGGSTTMNLLFRYPEIYKVGLASAGVPNQLIYNNIYEERFMGTLPENRDVYIKCSPITYAKNLQGHLLIMHGTGDHNVHYQGEEMLLNELIKYNRQFVYMPYPNRTHGISEGEGTGLHKTTLMANFLKQYCPPGGR